MEGRYSNPADRWEGIGPYYAMFPVSFAREVINKYSKEGDAILDPFAGRGTSLFAAVTQNRVGLGIEINPVGWLYSKVKLAPASQSAVEKRLADVSGAAHKYTKESAALPIFFKHCYSKPVLNFLCAARSELNWRANKADATLMAIILVNLHGKYGNALSNQMRQTKSMSPNYAVSWWKERGLKPPKLDPKEFLTKRIAWRYRHGIPNLEKSTIYLGDSTLLLDNFKAPIQKKSIHKPTLLFTSPPYIGVTNYHYDQWLRLWMLGYPSYPTSSPDKYRRKFNNAAEYEDMLRKVFSKSAQLLSKNAVIYVRTDYRKTTRDITKKVLSEVFPNKRVREKVQLVKNPTQTQLFTKDSALGGEVDFVLR